MTEQDEVGIKPTTCSARRLASQAVAVIRPRDMDSAMDIHRRHLPTMGSGPAFSDTAAGANGRRTRVTAYVVARRLRNQAVCGCGWHGKSRLLRGTSVADAFEHCNDFGHLPKSTTELWR